MTGSPTGRPSSAPASPAQGRDAPRLRWVRPPNAHEPSCTPGAIASGMVAAFPVAQPVEGGPTGFVQRSLAEESGGNLVQRDRTCAGRPCCCSVRASTTSPRSGAKTSPITASGSASTSRSEPSWLPSMPSAVQPDRPNSESASTSSSNRSDAARAIPASPTLSRKTPRATGNEFGTRAVRLERAAPNTRMSDRTRVDGLPETWRTQEQHAPPGLHGAPGRAGFYPLSVSPIRRSTRASSSRIRHAEISCSNRAAEIGIPPVTPRMRRASSSKSQMNSLPVACLE